MSVFAIAAPTFGSREIRIPKGSIVLHRGKRTLRKSSRTVELEAVVAGRVITDPWDHRGRGFVVLPQAEWVGAGGHISRVQLTPEMLASNNLDALSLPDVPENQVDVIPSVDEGYCDRWEADSEF